MTVSTVPDTITLQTAELVTMARTWRVEAREHRRTAQEVGDADNGGVRRDCYRAATRKDAQADAIEVILHRTLPYVIYTLLDEKINVE